MKFDIRKVFNRSKDESLDPERYFMVVSACLRCEFYRNQIFDIFEFKYLLLATIMSLMNMEQISFKFMLLDSLKADPKT